MDSKDTSYTTAQQSLENSLDSELKDIFEVSSFKTSQNLTVNNNIKEEFETSFNFTDINISSVPNDLSFDKKVKLKPDIINDNNTISDNNTIDDDDAPHFNFSFDPVPNFLPLTNIETEQHNKSRLSNTVPLFETSFKADDTCRSLLSPDADSKGNVSDISETNLKSIILIGNGSYLPGTIFDLFVRYSFKGSHSALRGLLSILNNSPSPRSYYDHILTQYIETTNHLVSFPLLSPLSDVENLSLFFWIKINENEEDEEGDIIKIGSYHIMWSECESDNRFKILFNLNLFQFSFRFEQWYSVAFVISNGKASLYVNGIFHSRVGIINEKPGQEIDLPDPKKEIDFSLKEANAPVSSTSDHLSFICSLDNKFSVNSNEKITLGNDVHFGSLYTFPEALSGSTIAHLHSLQNELHPHLFLNENDMFGLFDPPPYFYPENEKKVQLKLLFSLNVSYGKLLINGGSFPHSKEAFSIIHLPNHLNTICSFGGYYFLLSFLSPYFFNHYIYTIEEYTEIITLILGCIFHSPKMLSQFFSVSFNSLHTIFETIPFYLRTNKLLNIVKLYFTYIQDVDRLHNSNSSYLMNVFNDLITNLFYWRYFPSFINTLTIPDSFPSLPLKDSKPDVDLQLQLLSFMQLHLQQNIDHIIHMNLLKILDDIRLLIPGCFFYPATSTSISPSLESVSGYLQLLDLFITAGQVSIDDSDHILFMITELYYHSFVSEKAFYDYHIMLIKKLLYIFFTIMKHYSTSIYKYLLACSKSVNEVYLCDYRIFIRLLDLNDSDITTYSLLIFYNFIIASSNASKVSNDVAALLFYQLNCSNQKLHYRLPPPTIFTMGSIVTHVETSSASITPHLYYLLLNFALGRNLYDISILSSSISSSFDEKSTIKLPSILGIILSLLSASYFSLTSSAKKVSSNSNEMSFISRCLLDLLTLLKLNEENVLILSNCRYQEWLIDLLQVGDTSKFDSHEIAVNNHLIIHILFIIVDYHLRHSSICSYLKAQYEQICRYEMEYSRKMPIYEGWMVIDQIFWRLNSVVSNNIRKRYFRDIEYEIDFVIGKDVMRSESEILSNPNLSIYNYKLMFIVLLLIRYMQTTTSSHDNSLTSENIHDTTSQSFLDTIRRLSTSIRADSRTVQISQADISLLPLLQIAENLITKDPCSFLNLKGKYPTNDEIHLVRHIIYLSYSHYSRLEHRQDLMRIIYSMIRIVSFPLPERNVSETVSVCSPINNFFGSATENENDGSSHTVFGEYLFPVLFDAIRYVFISSSKSVNPPIILPTSKDKIPPESVSQRDQRAVCLILHYINKVIEQLNNFSTSSVQTLISSLKKLHDNISTFWNPHLNALILSTDEDELIGKHIASFNQLIHKRNDILSIFFTHCDKIKFHFIKRKLTSLISKMKAQTTSLHLNECERINKIIGIHYSELNLNMKKIMKRMKGYIHFFDSYFHTSSYFFLLFSQYKVTDITIRSVINHFYYPFYYQTSQSSNPGLSWKINNSLSNSHHQHKTLTRVFHPSVLDCSNTRIAPETVKFISSLTDYNYYEYNLSHLSDRMWHKEDGISYNCSLVTPKKRYRGIISVSSASICYVDNPVLASQTSIYHHHFQHHYHILKSTISNIYKHTNHHKLLGIEIFFFNDHFHHLFLFDNAEDFNSFTGTLSFSVDHLPLLTTQWQQQRISNFDYLMKLNFMSGRSYYDISQYPIFPWVLLDYSKDAIASVPLRPLQLPFGCVNPKRLSLFVERYQSYIDDTALVEKSLSSKDKYHHPPPFFYGSFYSSPIIVINFLLRLEPFTALHLSYQEGHFDLPDRIFSSLSSSFSSSFESLSDVSELIPEFYYLPEFLYNHNNLSFGKKQNNEIVNHVDLPYWATSLIDKNLNYSPLYACTLFVLLHHLAFESPLVSRGIHFWFDLIFGNKSRGIPAIKSFNLFYYLVYENITNDNVTEIKKSDIDVHNDQIDQFGCIPMQLFHLPHPPRDSLNSAESINIFEFFNEEFNRSATIEERRLNLDPNNYSLLFDENSLYFLKENDIFRFPMNFHKTHNNYCSEYQQRLIINGKFIFSAIDNMIYVYCNFRLYRIMYAVETISTIYFFDNYLFVGGEHGTFSYFDLNSYCISDSFKVSSSSIDYIVFDPDNLNLYAISYQKEQEFTEVALFANFSYVRSFTIPEKKINEDTLLSKSFELLNICYANNFSCLVFNGVFNSHENVLLLYSLNGDFLCEKVLSNNTDMQSHITHLCYNNSYLITVSNDMIAFRNFITLQIIFTFPLKYHILKILYSDPFYFLAQIANDVVLLIIKEREKKIQNSFTPYTSNSYFESATKVLSTTASGIISLAIKAYQTEENWFGIKGKVSDFLSNLRNY